MTAAELTIVQKFIILVGGLVVTWVVVIGLQMWRDRSASRRPRTYTWVILSCLHWYKSDATIAHIPKTLRCPNCRIVAEVLDKCPLTQPPARRWGLH